MSVVVLPGDIVNVEKRNQSIKLGPGLIQTDAIPSIVAVRAGVLHNHSNSWWIDSNAARVRNLLFFLQPNLIGIHSTSHPHKNQ
jgi:hypothetical protein